MWWNYIYSQFSHLYWDSINLNRKCSLRVYKIKTKKNLKNTNLQVILGSTNVTVTWSTAMQAAAKTPVSYLR